MKRFKLNKKTAVIASVTALGVAATTAALAMPVPVAGSMFFEAYDFASKLSTGAPAATIGIGGVASGGFFLFQQKIMPACGCAIGATVIAKSAAIATAMGFLI